jgi:hypothetical protein
VKASKQELFKELANLYTWPSAWLILRGARTMDLMRLESLVFGGVHHIYYAYL